MRRISEKKREEIIELRSTGHSIPEISATTGIARTTVQRYVKDVRVPHQYTRLLQEKQGGAKERAFALRKNIQQQTQSYIGSLSKRDRLMLLIGIYWGEGTKRDFSIINSDPYLIQTFIYALRTLRIPKERLVWSIRIHSNIPIPLAKKYWSRITGLSPASLVRVEIVEGKKKGKLPYGMCRVRILSGIRERLFIQQSIMYIGKEASEKVVSY